MTVYRFHAIKHRAIKSGMCVDCGKRTRRQVTFEQTLNPFNKLPDGTVKSARDISLELAEEAETWRAEPIQCGSCETAARERRYAERHAKSTSDSPARLDGQR